MPRLRFGACLAAALAVTRSPMLSASASNMTRATSHCEERSDAAIPRQCGTSAAEPPHGARFVASLLAMTFLAWINQ